jgi:hypothetical protein
VNVTVRVSETLLTTPFLSIAPNGGTPIAIDLARVSDTEYSGAFDITENIPSGTAFAVFSARDLVGNRGTDIGAGGSLMIDADGPAVSTISVVPPQPIRNNEGNPVAVTADFVLTETVKPGTLPSLAFHLSKAGRPTVQIGGVVQTGPLSYRASLQLPADAGETEVEYLEFVYSAADDLDNTSSKILANNRFQIYQGNLPPAGVPVNVIAKALPAGKIKLTWNAVDEASGYQIYRQAPGADCLSTRDRDRSDGSSRGRWRAPLQRGEHPPC